MRLTLPCAPLARDEVSAPELRGRATLRPCCVLSLLLLLLVLRVVVAVSQPVSPPDARPGPPPRPRRRRGPASRDAGSATVPCRWLYLTARLAAAVVSRFRLSAIGGFAPFSRSVVWPDCRVPHQPTSTSLVAAWGRERLIKSNGILSNFLSCLWLCRREERPRVIMCGDLWGVRCPERRW